MAFLWKDFFPPLRKAFLATGDWTKPFGLIHQHCSDAVLNFSLEKSHKEINIPSSGLLEEWTPSKQKTGPYLWDTTSICLPVLHFTLLRFWKAYKRRCSTMPLFEAVAVWIIFAFSVFTLVYCQPDAMMIWSLIETGSTVCGFLEHCLLCQTAICWGVLIS